MDTTLATFEKDVISASMLAPVLVDFWAPWCGPCKTLGPMLEKLEAEYEGKWRLVKVNVDENQELAAHFQVRSIPHVVAFADGRPVDQFIGVLPEGQLREFLDRLVPDGAEASRAEAAIAIAEGRREDAYDALKAALAYDPGFDEARLDLMSCCSKTTAPKKRRRKTICCRLKRRRASTRATTRSRRGSMPSTPPPTCRPRMRSKPPSPAIPTTSKRASIWQARSLPGASTIRRSSICLPSSRVTARSAKTSAARRCCPCSISPRISRNWSRNGAAS